MRGWVFKMNLDFSAVLPSFPYILKGVWVTLQIAFFAGIFGFVFGIILSLFKISNIKILNWIADLYTSIFRGNATCVAANDYLLWLPTGAWISD